MESSPVLIRLKVRAICYTAHSCPLCKKGSASMKLTGSRVFNIVVILVLGAIFGSVIHAQSRTSAKSDGPELQLFNKLLDAVEENAAMPIDSDKAIYGAIDGMLRTLDPHSKFFDPSAFKSLQE